MEFKRKREWLIVQIKEIIIIGFLLYFVRGNLGDNLINISDRAISRGRNTKQLFFFTFRM